MQGVLFFPSGIPLGVVLQGLVIGGLSSLTAMGLVLIYKASRIINFSQAAIGGLSGSFAMLATTGWNLNYYESVVIGLMVAILVGIVLELGVISRLRNAPRLILTVSTLGLYQVLGALEVGLPHLAGAENSSKTFGVPFSLNFTIGVIHFDGNYMLAMIMIPIVLLVLWSFIYKTSWGIAIRAVGDSSERTSLLGISVKKISLMTWVSASLLSGIAAILTVPIITPSLGTATSPQDLLAPLAAATLAGFESLWLAVIWSTVIGASQQIIYWSYPDSSTVSIVLFLLIIVGLFVQRRKETRSEGTQFSDYIAVRVVKPLSESIAKLRSVKVVKLVGGIMLVGTSIIVPMFASASQQILLTYISIFAIIAVSLVILTGWAGQISLGQFAFAGVGASACATLLVRNHADLFISLIVAAITGAVLSIIVGLPALRLPGLTLAAATLDHAQYGVSE